MRIGVYGGTFDPIHNGHLQIACAVAENFRLDELLIIPSARPPHKSAPVSQGYDRYAMAALATNELTHLFVSTVELEAPDQPYTFQTIGKLRSSYGPDATLFFLMGSDSFRDLGVWKRPEVIITESNVIVAYRPGYDMEGSGLPAFVAGSTVVDLRGQQEALIDPAHDEKRGSIYLTDFTTSATSSSDIRLRAGKGESISGLVPESVANYIQKYGLYRSAI